MFVISTASAAGFLLFLLVDSFRGGPSQTTEMIVVIGTPIAFLFFLIGIYCRHPLVYPQAQPTKPQEV